MEEQTESLGGGVRVHISRAHRFGTDAFLLADFARPRRGETACDLCSGCGIVALLWHREQERAPGRTTCIELQREAAELLAASVADSGLTGAVVPLRRDLRELGPADIAPGSVDLCACNPPYKAAGHGLLSAHAAQAAARHELSCTLGDVCAAAGRMLRFGGRLCICQRPERLCDLFAAMRAHGLEPKRLRMAHKRPEAAPWLALVEARRGGKPFLSVEPPLIVQDERGGYSAEMRRIYRLEEE